jgi:hypothetical protein
MRKKSKHIACICTSRVDADDGDVLIDTRGQNVVGNHARTREGDAVSSDVKKDVRWLEHHSAKTRGLFVCDEREPGVVEAPVKDILASHKSVALTSRHTRICPALWRRSRADLVRDLTKRYNGPSRVVPDGGLTRHTQSPSA